MSQAHIRVSVALAGTERGTKGDTIACTIVSSVPAALAQLELVGGESAAGAERACTRVCAR